MRGFPKFPDEIMIEILSRLPAESVGQFRCVSKPWRALLSEPQFIKTHLHHSKSRQESLILLSEDYHFISSAPLVDARQVFDEIIVILKGLDFGDYPDIWNRFIGFCDGLVLVSDTEHEPFVLNPVTQQIREVPPSPFLAKPRDTLTLYGLGYDSVRDDYKVGIVSYFLTKDPDPGFGVEAAAYSLKTGSWTRIEGCPQNYVFVNIDYGVFVGGCINWLAEDRDEYHKPVILAFDLVEEKLTEVPLPKPVGGEKWRFDRCEVIGGCLCVFTKDEPEFWAMIEYGASESWTKLTVDNPKCWPSCLLNHELVLMRKDGDDVVCNLKEGIARSIVLGNVAGGCYSIKSFTESLISPHGDN